MPWQSKKAFANILAVVEPGTSDRLVTHNTLQSPRKEHASENTDAKSVFVHYTMPLAFGSKAKLNSSTRRTYAFNRFRVKIPG